ncbi:MAG: PAS domain-containing protein [Burkholderiales bacterium]|nr:PAS domain-containing protein [Nitrosomonas sp.]MCP5245413.1 PAS domain-containing protein [Burkholderiales bacterium]
MNKKWDGIERRKSLRAEAEEMVKSFSVGSNALNNTEFLMHELLVHKIELETQNEELRRAHTAMEEARDRYVDFYEFAPVSYITINRAGMISAINLTGSALLGADRAKLINHRFSTFVAHSDRDHWHRQFRNMMKHDKDGPHKFRLEMIRVDGSQLYAHLNCLRKVILNEPPVLRVALTDITQQENRIERVE